MIRCLYTLLISFCIAPLSIAHALEEELKERSYAASHSPNENITITHLTRPRVTVDQAPSLTDLDQQYPYHPLFTPKNTTREHLFYTVENAKRNLGIPQDVSLLAGIEAMIDELRSEEDPDTDSLRPDLHTLLHQVLWENQMLKQNYQTLKFFYDLNERRYAHLTSKYRLLKNIKRNNSNQTSVAEVHPIV